MKSTTALAIAITTLFTTAAPGAPVVLDTAFNPNNGHTYHLLSNSDWTDAEAAAVGLGGHLATINDLAENNWVWDRWGTNRSLWIGLHDPTEGGGGAGDFVWVSGETSSYRNWNLSTGEPNGSRFTHIWGKGIVAGSGGGGFWNDGPDVASTFGELPFHGVVEIGVCTPHHATGTAVLLNGFVVDVTITDPGCGYTNAPQVTFQGGGGVGATATSVISNGVVTDIIVHTAGSGYTNAPDVLISSPPFVPVVSISVSRIKVSQKLMLGVNYILETSSDLNSWTPTGPSFTATNENMVTEFDVNSVGQYFRIKQVP